MPQGHGPAAGLRAGVAFALVAGLLWGLAFLNPQLLPDYPGLLLSIGRYLAFGLLALPLAWLDRAGLRQLTGADWRHALGLAAIGNLLYYLLLASAIQRTGGPLPTMIIGTLPVLIAVCANLRRSQQQHRLPWRRLAPALLLIGLGLALVNQVELAALQRQERPDLWRYGSGALLALGALACWTWYPLRNADWLLAHPERNPRVWATAQGLATLPLALAGLLLFWLLGDWLAPGWAMPLGPRPALFLASSAALGLLASWVGTLCWNEASQRLPTALTGQLIVFETLAALAYAYLWRGEWPQPQTLAGIALLLAGVLWGLHAAAAPRRRTA